MARTIGVQFSVGASVQRTVASAFGTVASRVKGLKGDLRDLEKQSKAATRLTAAMDKRTKIKAEYKANPTDELRAALTTANHAYGRAKLQARDYGVTVQNVAQAHAVLSARIERTQASLDRQKQLQANQAKRSEIHGQILGTVASVMTVAAPIKMAIDFESNMADAAKTIEGMRDASGKLTPKFYGMQTAVKELGRTLPLTHSELASLFAAGGQQGMTGTEELKEFTTMSAHMSVAFGMGTEAAAEAIGGYRTALGLSMPQTREMLDLMNYYANTGTSTEKGIAEVVRRVGALGDVSGVSYKPMVALAATMDAMKIAPENAATGIQKLLLVMGKGNAATKAQKKAFASIGFKDTNALAKRMQTDGPAAIMSVLEAIKKLPAHKQASVLTEIFGEEGVRTLAPLLNRLDLLRENMEKSGDSSKYAGAMQEEFENRSKTTANALIIAKNRLSELGITLGSVVLPAIVKALETVGPYISAVARFAETHQTAAAVAFTVVGALVALKVATMTGRYAATMLSDAWNVTKGVFSFCRSPIQRTNEVLFRQRGAGSAAAAGMRESAAATRQATRAMRAQNRMTSLTARGLRGIGKAWMIATGPIGWVVAGLEILYNAFEPVRTVVDWIVSAVSSIPVIGPIIKTIANTLGFGGDIPDYEAIGPEREAMGPVVEAKTTTPKTVAAPSVQALPPQAIAAPAEDWSSDPYMHMYKMGRPTQPAENTDEPPSAKAWYDPTGWFGGDEPAPVTAAQPMQTASGPAETAAVSQPGAVIQPMTTAPFEPEPPSPGAPASRTGTTSPEKQPSAARGSATGGAAGSTVSLTQEITLNGITDADFARRVVDAVKARRGDFERLLSSIVDDQKRLAYGR